MRVRSEDVSLTASRLSIVPSHVAVVESVVAARLAVVSVEAVVLEVLVDMASVVLAGVQSLLCSQLFGSCVHSCLVLVVIHCCLLCEYTKKNDTWYCLSHFSFIFLRFLGLFRNVLYICKKIKQLYQATINSSITDGKGLTLSIIRTYRSRKGCNYSANDFCDYYIKNLRMRELFYRQD